MSNSVTLSMPDRARLAQLLHRMDATNRPLERELASVAALRILNEYGLTWNDAKRVTGNH